MDSDKRRRFYGAVTVSERGQIVVPAERGGTSKSSEATSSSRLVTATRASLSCRSTSCEGRCGGHWTPCTR